MKKVRLKEICDLQNGYAFKSTDYIEKSNTLNCRMSNIRPGAVFDIEYSPKYLPDEFVKKYEEFILKDGDIVIAMTDLADDPKILGVPAEVDTKGKNVLLNQRVGKLIIKNKDKIYYSYLKYVLSNPANKEYYKKFAGGGLQLNISKKDILNLEIPIYEINKQMEISNKLNKIQEIINIRKKQIEQLDELIKSQFVEMFGDIKNDDFDNSQIKDLVDTNIIKTKKKFKKNDVIKYIDISSIDNIKNEIIGFTEYKIGDEPSRAQQCLVKGDILISTVRPNLKNIAVNDYNDENIIGSSGFCVLRPNKCELEYLLAVVKSEKFTNDMVAKTTGANYPAIHSTDILNYEIAVPPIELQNQFAKIVKQIDKQKSEIQKSLEETQKLQDSLMNKYFG